LIEFNGNKTVKRRRCGGMLQASYRKAQDRREMKAETHPVTFLHLRNFKFLQFLFCCCSSCHFPSISATPSDTSLYSNYFKLVSTFWFTKIVNFSCTLQKGVDQAGYASSGLLRAKVSARGRVSYFESWG